MKSMLPTVIGHWENPHGYKCTHHHNERYFLLFSKPIFLVLLDPEAPLTWVWLQPVVLNGMRLPAMTRMQFDRKFLTDKGSTPKLLQLMFDRAKHEREYLTHDSGYEDHGLYFKRPQEHCFRFLQLRREDLDKILSLQIQAQGEDPIERGCIYGAVRVCGGRSWEKQKRSSQEIRLPEEAFGGSAWERRSGEG